MGESIRDLALKRLMDMVHGREFLGSFIAVIGDYAVNDITSKSVLQVCLVQFDCTDGDTYDYYNDTFKARVKELGAELGIPTMVVDPKAILLTKREAFAYKRYNVTFPISKYHVRQYVVNQGDVLMLGAGTNEMPCSENPSTRKQRDAANLSEVYSLLLEIEEVYKYDSLGPSKTVNRINEKLNRIREVLTLVSDETLAAIEDLDLVVREYPADTPIEMIVSIYKEMLNNNCCDSIRKFIREVDMAA